MKKESEIHRIWMIREKRKVEIAKEWSEEKRESKGGNEWKSEIK